MAAFTSFNRPASFVPVAAAALVICVLAAVSLIVPPASACNEQVCASVVSKCMLTASCKCDLKNCSCCKECFNCLSYLYTECCSCVDMCPKPNATRNGLSSRSHVEDLEGIPGLFKALTDVEEDDWSTITYPVDFDAALYGAKFDWDMVVISHGEPKIDASISSNKVATGGGGVSVGSKIVTYNCTVAFMSQCLSWNKCKTNCQSMGASSYRWFHDGCCECIGSTCLNYGVNESRCMGCPDLSKKSKDDAVDGVDGDEQEQQDEAKLLLPHEDDLDYGHLNGPLDDQNI